VEIEVVDVVGAVPDSGREGDRRQELATGPDVDRNLATIVVDLLDGDSDVFVNPIELGIGLQRGEVYIRFFPAISVDNHVDDLEGRVDLFSDVRILQQVRVTRDVPRITGGVERIDDRLDVRARGRSPGLGHIIHSAERVLMGRDGFRVRTWGRAAVSSRNAQYIFIEI